jgi:hypothetical protein
VNDSFAVTVHDGKLTNADIGEESVDATVVCDAPDYITMLHRPLAGRRGHNEPVSYQVDGDAAVLERLLASLN